MNLRLRKIYLIIIFAFFLVIAYFFVIQFVMSSIFANDKPEGLADVNPEIENRGAIIVDGKIIVEDVASNNLDYSRTYYQGNLYSQITGFYNRQLSNRLGIEQSENSFLNGQSNLLKLEQLRNQIFDLEAVNYSVELTISPKYQELLYEKLTEFPGAAGIILDAESGKILALVSFPDYDPNLLVIGEGGVQYFEELGNQETKPLKNRTLESVFTSRTDAKILKWFNLFESGVSWDQTISLNSPQLYYSKTQMEELGCFESEVITVGDAMSKGCDEIISDFADDSSSISESKIPQYAKEFGFNKEWILDDDQEDTPFSSVSSTLDKFHNTFSTLLQETQLMSALVLDGKLYQPMLTQSLIRSDFLDNVKKEPEIFSDQYFGVATQSSFQNLKKVLNSNYEKISTPNDSFIQKIGFFTASENLLPEVTPISIFSGYLNDSSKKYVLALMIEEKDANPEKIGLEILKEL